jgi:hypothetical protein
MRVVGNVLMVSYTHSAGDFDLAFNPTNGDCLGRVFSYSGQVVGSPSRGYTFVTESDSKIHTVTAIRWAL